MRNLLVISFTLLLAGILYSDVVVQEPACTDRGHKYIQGY